MNYRATISKWFLLLLLAASMLLSPGVAKAEGLEAWEKYTATLSQDGQDLDTLIYQATPVSLNGESDIFLLPHSHSGDDSLESSFKPITQVQLMDFLQKEGVSVSQFKAWLKKYGVNPGTLMDLKDGYGGSVQEFAAVLDAIDSALGAEDPAVQFFSDFLGALNISMQDFEDALQEDGMSVSEYVALMDMYAVDFLTLLDLYYRSGAGSFRDFMVQDNGAILQAQASMNANSAGEYRLGKSKWEVYTKPIVHGEKDGNFTWVTNSNDTNVFSYSKDVKDHRVSNLFFGFGRHPVGYHFWIKFHFDLQTASYNGDPAKAPGRYIRRAVFPVYDIMQKSELFGFAALDHVYAYSTNPINMGVSEPAAQIDITMCFQFRAMGESVQRFYKFRANAASGAKRIE